MENFLLPGSEMLRVPAGVQISAWTVFGLYCPASGIKFVVAHEALGSAGIAHVLSGHDTGKGIRSSVDEVPKENKASAAGRSPEPFGFTYVPQSF